MGETPGLLDSSLVTRLPRTDDLRQPIQDLVNELETSPENSHSVSALCQKYSIERRKLYDLFNVFASIGCCTKNGLDYIVWHGKAAAVPFLQQARDKRMTLDPRMTLVSLFPANQCIGIANLTINLCLLFFAVMSNKLDLRFVAQLFSHNTTRYKTTLCKLYQISYILGAAGITTRTDKVCQVVLNRPYFSVDTLEPAEPEPSDTPLSIFSLLNRKVAITSSPRPRALDPQNMQICRRREELVEVFKFNKSAKSILAEVDLSDALAFQRFCE